MEVCILGIVQKFNKEHCYLVRYHPFMKSMKAQWEMESCGFDKKIYRIGGINLGRSVS